LVEANLRLVLWELGKTQRAGVDVEDLIQEGNFALLRAAELYDPARDIRFSSYAIWWIRARIKRAIQQRHAPVRLPLHVQRRLNDLKSRAQRLAVELQREPTVTELATAAGLGVEATRKLLARAASLESVSLHAPGSDHSSASLENALPDPNGVTALDALVQRELEQWVRGTLTNLTEREKTVLMLRFGFDEEERELSLAEIAREFGLSRERVRQIETAALRRLTSGTRRAELVARCDSSRAPALKRTLAKVEQQLKRLRARSKAPDVSVPLGDSEHPDPSE
jgi:RNA polymerase sigma factor (sigma-70 family)